MNVELIITIIGVAGPIVLGLYADIKQHKTLKGRVSSLEKTLIGQESHLQALDNDIQALIKK